METREYISTLIKPTKETITDTIFADFGKQLSYIEQADLGSELHEAIGDSIGKTLGKFLQDKFGSKHLLEKKFNNTINKFSTEIDGLNQLSEKDKDLLANAFYNNVIDYLSGKF